MADKKKYRHEFKYLISTDEDAILEQRISALIPRDPHVGPSGKYVIRSLYFDSYGDRCYYENENGTDPREKFRIRIYNASDRSIKLECKRKERAKTLKTSCSLSREQCMSLMAGRIPQEIGEKQAVLRKLAMLMNTELFRPKVIVEYNRTPYIYKNGNVRVTFDRDIRSSTEIARFLEPVLYARPIMPAGQNLIEVKYDEYIPDFIKESLEIGSLSQTAFSKYYLCRKFSIGGSYVI